MIAFITGSGLYGLEGLATRQVTNRFGTATLLQGKVNGREILLLPRHGTGHANLPNHINYRANLLALKEHGATAIISTSVCGLLRSDWPLGCPLLVDDLLYAENRLPDGTICSIFDQPGEPGRGHLLAESYFDKDLAAAVCQLWTAAGTEWREGTYVHANGPRFNTRAEIRLFRSWGGDFLSQTCGPEAVLANELEIPFALVAFTVDYANGVASEPTSIETLNANLTASGEVFRQLIHELPAELAQTPFKNFVYRFQ